jgi:hypothetical protein
MGGEPWMYFVEHDEDVEFALDALKVREFRAGRYNPVMPFPPFPADPSGPAPGAKHSSIEEAREAADADGTRSILDMDRIGDEPDFGVVVPLDRQEIIELYGTEHPTRAMIEANPDFLEEVERGQGVYLVAYDGDRPAWICFGGYSYD